MVKSRISVTLGKRYRMNYIVYLDFNACVIKSDDDVFTLSGFSCLKFIHFAIRALLRKFSLKLTFQTFDSFFTILGLQLPNDTHIMGRFDRYCWKICVRKFEKKLKKCFQYESLYLLRNDYVMISAKNFHTRPSILE